MKYLLLVLLSGCFVSPPLRVTAGAGGTGGDVAVRSRSGLRSVVSHAPHGEIRAGFPFLSLDPARFDRRIDVSPGVAFVVVDAEGERPATQWGPFLDVAWFAMGAAPTEDFRWRLGPTAHVDLVGGEDFNGIGGAIGVVYEYVAPEDYKGSVSVARGEYGVGVSARVGVREVDDGTYAFALLAIELRAPGILSLPVPRGRQNSGVFQ